MIHYINSIKKGLQLLILPLLITSCEEVIEIDLSGTEPVLVVEALLEKDSLAFVRLTKTSDYFDNSASPIVENANIVLSNEEGEQEVLQYLDKGYYYGSSLLGELGSYTMKVQTETYDIEAESSILTPVEVYDMYFEILDTKGGPGYDPEMDTYKITLKFSDNPAEHNFYMLRYWANGELVSPTYTLMEDKYVVVNDTIEFTPFFDFFYANDLIDVHIYSLDESAFKYYSQLNDQMQKGMGGGSTPYNPQSNFGTGIMGYFAARSLTKAQAVVLDKKD